MATTKGAPAVRPGSPELADLLARIAEGNEQRERELMAPHEVIGWIKEAGLGRLRIPLEEGGGGATMRELFETLIALSRADSNTAQILRTHYWFVEQRLASADAADRGRGFALVNAGAIFGNGFAELTGKPVGMEFETEFTRDPEGGYRLNGAKNYCTGTPFSDYTQIWAAAPEGRIAGTVIPVDRRGVTIEDDWDGFGQRLTGTVTTRLENVHVSEDEYFDLGEAGAPQPPSYLGSFLQLYLQAVTAGILYSVQDDTVKVCKLRKRNFSHSTSPYAPTGDPQVMQVVGEIAADAFAAEAIVLMAAERLQDAADSVVDGIPSDEAAQVAQCSAAQAKVAVDRFAAQTAARLFDAGGASATSTTRNLDRHWRNIRTISTHNPTFLKASAVGDHIVNGTLFPANAYF